MISNDLRLNEQDLSYHSPIQETGLILILKPLKMRITQKGSNNDSEKKRLIRQTYSYL